MTVWFANFAEALAEGRGKAKADALRRTRSDLVGVRVLEDGHKETVPAKDLRKGDIVTVEKDNVMPADGEVIEGACLRQRMPPSLANSAPVLKEAGTDIVLVRDRRHDHHLRLAARSRVTTNPGDTFLDRMIRLVEGAKRQKTPNEIALTVLLSILTLIFVIVVASIAPVATYLQAQINVADLVALLS